MLTLINDEAILCTLRKGKVVAFPQDGGHLRFTIRSIRHYKVDYVLLERVGSKGLKVMPLSNLVDERWCVENGEDVGPQDKRS